MSHRKQRLDPLGDQILRDRSLGSLVDVTRAPRRKQRDARKAAAAEV